MAAKGTESEDGGPEQRALSPPLHSTHGCREPGLCSLFVLAFLPVRATLQGLSNAVGSHRPGLPP